MVAVERTHGAIVAVVLVELAAAVAVVDEQHRTTLHATGHRLQPVRQLRQHFGTVALGERLFQVALDMAHRTVEQDVGRLRATDEVALGVQLDGSS